MLAFQVGATTNTAIGKPVVRWMTVDFPPLFMVTGPEHGVGDYAQGIAVSRLTNYEHVLQAVPPNYQRIEEEMRNHEDVCFAGFLKTQERERFMTFSKPYLMMLPVQLFVDAERPQPLTLSGGQVDLQALLGEGNFRLGILGGRRYGAFVDAVVDAHNYSAAVYRRYSKDQLRGLLNMMTSHEHGLDGLLAYSTEIRYLSAQPGASLVPLRSYPLKGAPAFLFGYFACSASDMGRDVISRIDDTIPGIRAEVAQLYAHDLSPDDRAAYARLVHEQWGLSLPDGK